MNESIQCKCGAVFEWTPTEGDDLEFYDLKPSRCADCEDCFQAEQQEARRLESERKTAAVIETARQAAENKTPAIFRLTDTAHPKFNLAAWLRIEPMELTEAKPWLGLVGATGTCKTRIAYLKAAQEIARMTITRGTIPSFAFMASYEITDLASKLNSSDYREKDAARAELAELRRTRLLLIDDLGKGRLSPAVASELFALVDHRYANGLAMIWTANSTPEEIAAGLSPDMAAPFAGRLNDSSRICRFK